MTPLLEKLKDVAIGLVIAAKIAMATGATCAPPALIGAMSQTGAQITMQNNSSETLDLYVDGNYCGTALRGLYCTAQVDAGPHGLEARRADGSIYQSGSVDLAEGQSYTWTVSGRQTGRQIRTMLGRSGKP